jgi:hypothetical protein
LRAKRSMLGQFESLLTRPMAPSINRAEMRNLRFVARSCWPFCEQR